MPIIRRILFKLSNFCPYLLQSHPILALNLNYKKKISMREASLILLDVGAAMYQPY